jgi:hypothetical protein
LLAACGPGTPVAPAHLVLRGGRIHTLDPARPWAEAIALRDDRVAAVGSAGDVEEFIGRDTEVIDLESNLVLPGFNDGHIHFLEGALRLDQVKLGEARSLDEMRKMVKAYAAEHLDRPWIQGMGWIYSYIDGGRLPTRQDLDVVVADRPVYLEAYDGHTAWTNTKALQIAGISGRSRAQGYGEVVMDPVTGEPTGVLKEPGAMDLVRSLLPRPTREEKLAALRRGMGEALRFGVTSIQIAHGSPTFEPAPKHAEDELDLYEELERAGELSVRVYFAVSVDKDTTAGELSAIAALKDRLPGPWVKAGAIKIVMDGVIESHTAALFEPYADEPATRGQPDYSQEEIDALVLEGDRRGLQIFTHAIGDRSVRMVLDAYQRAAREDPGRPRRHRIEHIEVSSEEDHPRFAVLGVLGSMQPHHASPDITGVWARNVGKERVRRAFAWRALRQKGARLVHGSDWPVVSIDPLLGIYTAVTREDLDGKPSGGWVPEERLSVEEAVRGYTLDAAFASFDEAVKGSLEPGKLADLVVLDGDLFKMPPRRIPETEVLMAVVGGRARYVSPRFLDGPRREKLLQVALAAGR